MKSFIVIILTIVSLTSYSQTTLPDEVVNFYMQRHEYATFMESQLGKCKGREMQLRVNLELQSQTITIYKVDSAQYNVKINNARSERDIATTELKDAKKAHRKEIRRIRIKNGIVTGSLILLEIGTLIILL